MCINKIKILQNFTYYFNLCKGEIVSVNLQKIYIYINITINYDRTLVKYVAFAFNQKKKKKVSNHFLVFLKSLNLYFKKKKG